MKRIYLHILILVVLSSLLRFFLLDRIPSGISGDELDYVLNAKAVAVTGKDISGLWSPFSFSPPPYEYPKAELPSLVIAPFFVFMPLSLFWARFPFALFSVLFVVLLYFISIRLFSQSQAFVIGLIASINPWFIHFGRTAFDTPLSVYFYFLAFYLLLVTKKNWIFLAFPFFALAFFSYVGAKVIYVPFLIIATAFAWTYNKMDDSKRYVLFVLICLVPLLFFLTSLKFRSIGLRTGDLVSISSVRISNEVNQERRFSIQTPLTPLFSNKFNIFFKQEINNYIGVFSTSYLFLYSENTPFISFRTHGIFYYLDFVFIIIGFLVLFNKYKRIFLLFLSIILIAPLPSIASEVGVSYSIRASLMFPVFVMIIGVGIWYIISLKKLRLYKITSYVIIAAYVILLLNFLNTLFFNSPINSSETFGFSGREVSRYVQLAKNNNEKALFIDTPSDFIPYFFKQYLFYSNGYNKNTAYYISRAVRNKHYVIENFIISDCPKNTDNTIIIIAPPNSKCPLLSKFPHPLTISRLSDGGGIYNIYNDKICSKYNLKRYSSFITINDLKVEQLPEKYFCEKFISNL